MSQVHSTNILGPTSEIFTMCNNICINNECMFCDFIRNHIFIWEYGMHNSQIRDSLILQLHTWIFGNKQQSSHNKK